MIQLSLMPTDEQAVPADYVYRSYAVPLGIDEHSGCERFARGFHRLERWRSIEESCGNHGLPPNTSIMLPESGRIAGYVSFKKHATADELPEVNGSWKRTAVVENTNDGSMVVYAKCCGPACCESKTPAMKRLSVNDWARRLTMCLECSNYVELAKRINAARKEQLARVEAEAVEKRLHKSTPYERERRAKRKEQGLCIQCPTSKPDDGFARCKRCRDQNMDNWRRYKQQCRRKFLRSVETG